MTPHPALRVTATGPAHRVVDITVLAETDVLAGITLYRCACDRTMDEPTMLGHLGRFGLTPTGAPYRREGQR